MSDWGAWAPAIAEEVLASAPTPAGRLLFLADRLDGAIRAGLPVDSVIAAVTVLRATAGELEPAANDQDQAAVLRRKLARIEQMAAAWEQRFPDTIRTTAVVEALRTVIRETPC